MKKLIYLITVLIVTAGVLYSCTDLDETVRDTALQQDALDHPEVGERTLAPMYQLMTGPLMWHNWLNNMQGVASIEQIVPFRGGTDWFDGGRFIEMHQHAWTPVHITIIDVWQNFTQAIGRGAIAQQTINEQGGDQALIAEARALKALYNWWLLDLYNVAFEKSSEDVGTNVLSTVYRGAEAVDYIYNELDEVQGQLSRRASDDETRFNQDAVKALKVRLLLNKAVYSDRYASEFSHNSEDLNMVIALTTELIDDGYFQLESEDYFDLFGLENEGNPEVIFALDQEPETGGIRRMGYFHSSRDRYGHLDNTSKTGSDGGALTQNFFDLWEGERDDPRYHQQNLPDGGTIPDEEFEWNRGVEVGQQYGIVRDIDGSNRWKRDENGDLIIEALVDHSRSGDMMNYSREVGIESDRGHMAGSRSLKWSIDHVNPEGSGVNFPVFRLAEMYLSRAEAYARMGDWGAALSDINDLRNIRGARQLDASELQNMQDLEREWIYEMWMEHLTRTIQIRFESFTGGDFHDVGWRDKEASDVTRRVFPIPQDAIDAARGEPGYLEQNPGY